MLRNCTGEKSFWIKSDKTYTHKKQQQKNIKKQKQQQNNKQKL